MKTPTFKELQLSHQKNIDKTTKNNVCPLDVHAWVKKYSKYASIASSVVKPDMTPLECFVRFFCPSFPSFLRANNYHQKLPYIIYLTNYHRIENAKKRKMSTPIIGGLSFKIKIGGTLLSEGA